MWLGSTPSSLPHINATSMATYVWTPFSSLPGVEHCLDIKIAVCSLYELPYGWWHLCVQRCSVLRIFKHERKTCKVLQMLARRRSLHLILQRHWLLWFLLQGSLQPAQEPLGKASALANTELALICRLHPQQVSTTSAHTALLQLQPHARHGPAWRAPLRRGYRGLASHAERTCPHQPRRAGASLSITQVDKYHVLGPCCSGLAGGRAGRLYCTSHAKQ